MISWIQPLVDSSKCVATWSTALSRQSSARITMNTAAVNTKFDLESLISAVCVCGRADHPFAEKDACCMGKSTDSVHFVVVDFFGGEHMLDTCEL